MVYKSLIRPALFKLNPESAHGMSSKVLKWLHKIPLMPLMLSKMYSFEHQSLERELFGIKFKNPVGLAAGFDKDGIMFDELASLGFGFIELGTVTPMPQPGNEKPRIFRLVSDRALINRMGFNNQGAEVLAQRLKSRRNKNLVIGANIGKNKTTPNDLAENDYAYCFNVLYDVADYFAVNVSSPNTPDLRSLQEKEPLKKILNRLQNINQSKSKPKPILLKVAPDLTNHQLDDIIEVILETRTAGLIASNTSLGRTNLKSSKSLTKEQGGLSGPPIHNRSTEIIRYVTEKSKGAFPIIGVGGIHSPEDAVDKIKAGASLVQIYTGFIYKGPSLVKDIKNRLLRMRL